MRVIICVVVTGFMSFCFARTAQSGDRPDPAVIEAKLRKVREQLDRLRAEERVLAEQLADANATAPGSIKAEVSGFLRHDTAGGSYYISVRSSNGETRIWLPPSDKRRDQLGSLHGKAVVATGGMHQRHRSDKVPYVWTEKEVPEGAFYLWPFEIAAAPGLSPKK